MATGLFYNGSQIEVTGSIHADLSGITGSLQGTATHAITANTAVSASYVKVAGDNITVKNSANGIEITGSVVSTPNLQAVTTVGNQTSASVFITGSMTNGVNVLAVGTYSHAEGTGSVAIGDYSHAEGDRTTAIGIGSHAKGSGAVASGLGSHAEGENTLASGSFSHAEGKGTIITALTFGTGSVRRLIPVGYSDFSPTNSPPNTINFINSTTIELEGDFTGASWNGPWTNEWFIEDSVTNRYASITFTPDQTKVSAVYNAPNTTFTFTEPFPDTFSIPYSNTNSAIGDYSHTEGEETTAIGNYSHAEGQMTTAMGQYSHAEGAFSGESSFGPSALGVGSHAEGGATSAVGMTSHAEGSDTKALGDSSHAEGYNTRAIGYASHAEGSRTTAVGEMSHAEGGFSDFWATDVDGGKALGGGSHAEGGETTAKSAFSHAEGRGTIASKAAQHAEGTWNLEDTDAIWVVGDGTSNAARSNVIAAYTNKVTISGSLVTFDPTNVIGGNNLVHLVPGTNVTITSGSTGYTINAAGGGTATPTGSLLVTASAVSSTITFTKGDGSTFDITLAGGGGTGADSMVLNGNNLQLKSGSAVLSTVQIYPASSSATATSASWASSSISASYAVTATTANTASFVTTAQTASFVTLAQTASFVTTAQTASYFLTSSVSTASYVKVVGNNITVAYSANGIELTGSGGGSAPDLSAYLSSSWTGSVSSQFSGTSSYALTASYVVEKQNLQDVTTKGNQTSASVHITGSLTNGSGVLATGVNSHAEGLYSIASGDYSHAEGGPGSDESGYVPTDNVKAIGTFSHAEGLKTTAIGDNSHTEGETTTAVGAGAHAEGQGTIAAEQSSHAEGQQTTSIGIASHAEGYQTTSVGGLSHAEGQGTIAGGATSHAEGFQTKTEGSFSHAEGFQTTAKGDNAHAEGKGTIADTDQHVEGRYNEEDPNAIWIVGQGIGDGAGFRKNLIAAYDNLVTITGSLFTNEIGIWKDAAVNVTLNTSPSILDVVQSGIRYTDISFKGSGYGMSAPTSTVTGNPTFTLHNIDLNIPTKITLDFYQDNTSAGNINLDVYSDGGSTPINDSLAGSPLGTPGDPVPYNPQNANGFIKAVTMTPADDVVAGLYLRNVSGVKTPYTLEINIRGGFMHCKLYSYF